MSSLATPILLGLALGLGLASLAIAFARRRLPLDAVLEALAEPRSPVEMAIDDGLVSRLARSVAPPGDRELRKDLAIVGRTEEAHAVDKVRTTLFWAVLPALAVVVWSAAGVALNPALAVVAVPVLGAFGWFMSDYQVRDRARTRRAEFRSALVSYLQLVTILLAGGAGVNQALFEAASYGQGWSFDVLQRSLRDSQARNASPWDGFARVAEELSLPPLLELSASMRLAGESGAHVRNGLLAKSESLRIHELTEIEADAAAASEKMGGPVGGMVIGFVITMGYPAFATILAL